MRHEDFIREVQRLVAKRSPEHADRIMRCKLAYGVGRPGLRGVTIYSAWVNGHGPTDPDPFVEICAAGEESVAQLAGTTIHELGHVVAGWDAGHSATWKETCAQLGLRCVRAAGTVYHWSMLDPALRAAITALGTPSDGSPQLRSAAAGFKIGKRPSQPGPCTAGVGTRGGTSRGAGSGSRLRKYVCNHGQIIRASTDELNATCNVCSSAFKRAD